MTKKAISYPVARPESRVFAGWRVGFLRTSFSIEYLLILGSYTRLPAVAGQRKTDFFLYVQNNPIFEHFILA
jgi:hypothetical protein